MSKNELTDKMRYDLAMQCALAYVINKRITSSSEIENTMVNQFHKAWQSYARMDSLQFTIPTEKE